jgi:hypothetical protein
MDSARRWRSVDSPPYKVLEHDKMHPVEDTDTIFVAVVIIHVECIRSIKRIHSYHHFRSLRRMSHAIHVTPRPLSLVVPAAVPA